MKLLLILFNISVIVSIGYLIYTNTELMNFLRKEWKQKELKKMSRNKEDTRNYEEYLNDEYNEISKQFNESFEKEENENENENEKEV